MPQSKQRLAKLETEIESLQQRVQRSGTQIWKAEKATLTGATKIKEQIERVKLELEAGQRKQDYARMSELQYGQLPELEKPLTAAQEAEQKGFRLWRTRSPTRRSPRSSAAGPASRSARCWRASARSCCRWSSRCVAG